MKNILIDYNKKRLFSKTCHIEKTCHTILIGWRHFPGFVEDFDAILCFLVFSVYFSSFFFLPSFSAAVQRRFFHSDFIFRNCRIIFGDQQRICALIHERFALRKRCGRFARPLRQRKVCVEWHSQRSAKGVNSRTRKRINCVSIGHAQ